MQLPPRTLALPPYAPRRIVCNANFLFCLIFVVVCGRVVGRMRVFTETREGGVQMGFTADSKAGGIYARISKHVNSPVDEKTILTTIINKM